MNNCNIVFLGLDTHKETTDVAYMRDGRDEKPQHIGKIPSTKQGFTKLARQMSSKFPNATLHFVYEAGPCGYWIYRLLTSLGHLCYVVAPSLIPKKPGVRVKTDKRDSMMLAQLLRSGDIDPIYVPEPRDKAIRARRGVRVLAAKSANANSLSENEFSLFFPE